MFIENRANKRNSESDSIPQLLFSSKNSTTTVCSTQRPTSNIVPPTLHSQRNYSEYQFTKNKYSNPYQILPEVKFGTVFGSVEQATERHFKSKLRQVGSTQPTQLQVATETIKRLTAGKQFSKVEKSLLQKIAEMQQKIKVLQQKNPKLKSQNRQLRNINNNMRVKSNVIKMKAENWQKYNTNKQEQLRQSENKLNQLENRLSRSVSHQVFGQEIQVQIINIR